MHPLATAYPPTMSDYRLLAVPVLLGLVGVYLLLPQARGSRPRWGALLAAVGLITGGWLLIRYEAAWPETVLFYAFAAVAIVSGALLVTQANPVYAALSFALVVLSTCGLFLLQGAPFLMAATVVVYAGAIVVTFLFVIMLAQQEGPSDADQRSREPLFASVAGFVLVAALLYALDRTCDMRALDDLVGRAAAAADADASPDPDAALGNADAFLGQFQKVAQAARGSPDRIQLIELAQDTRLNWTGWAKEKNVAAMREALDRLAETGARVRDAAGMPQPHEPTRERLSAFSVPQRGLVGPNENVAPLGRSLFTDYLLAVELAGTLLLVATVGAIAIAGRRKEGFR